MNYFVFYKHLLIENHTFYLFLQGHNDQIAESSLIFGGHVHLMPTDFVGVLLQLSSHFHLSLLDLKWGGSMTIFLCFILF